jgi:DNA-binding CsgD family transcriptional regulator
MYFQDLDPDGVRLTYREFQVIRLLAGGMRDRQMATSLGIGPATIRTHVKRICLKFQTRSRITAVGLFVLHHPAIAREFLHARIHEEATTGTAMDQHPGR